MPANTPIFGFPYPLGTDPVSQGDNDIRALAEDVETVVAKTGLWLVKTQAVGATPVPSVVVTNAFNADYDNYRIVWSGGSGSAVDWIYMTLNNASGLSYGYGASFVQYGGTPGTPNSSGDSKWWVGIYGSTFSISLDVYQPYATSTTSFTSQSASNAYSVVSGGYNSNSASHTDFTFTAAGVGTSFTGGTIRVYGYNN